MIPYLPELFNSVLLVFLTYFLCDGIGRFIAQKIGQTKDGLNIAIGPFLGLTALVSLFSALFFFFKTTQTLVFLVLVWAIFTSKTKVKLLELNFQFRSSQLLEMGTLVFFILLRYFQLLDQEYPELNTENCDMYNYMDNMVWQEMYKVENSYTELESKHFGFPEKFMNYHFWEFNLGILLKNVWFFKNYTFFHLALLPLILGIAVISLSRASSWQFKTPLSLSIFIFILFTSYHRENNIIWHIISPLSKFIILKNLDFFPFHSYLDSFFLYPSSFIPKISVLLFCFSGYWLGVKAQNSHIRFISLSLIFTSNISYFAFFLFYELIHFFIYRESLKTLRFLFLLCFSFFAYSFYANFGEKTIGREVFFKILPFLSFESIYQSINKEILWIFGNFYSPFLYFFILILIIKPDIKRLFYLLLILFFPLTFQKYEVLGKLFIGMLFILTIINFKNFWKFLNSDEFLSFGFFSFISVLVLVSGTPFIAESFQVGYNIFICLISIIPVYILLKFRIEKARKWLLFICFIAFMALNLESNAFYFNRIFFPGTSENFSKSFLKMVPDSAKINAIYFTRFHEVPYFYVDRPAFNLQNHTDSLFSTCVSFNLLSKSDTLKIKQKNLWDRFLSWPFNQYIAGEGKGKSYEGQVKGFMKRIGCRAIFINKEAIHDRPAFLSELVSDSLYCQQFDYWAYKVK
jgi:hypothetical protein